MVLSCGARNFKSTSEEMYSAAIFDECGTRNGCAIEISVSVPADEQVCGILFGAEYTESGFSGIAFTIARNEVKLCKIENSAEAAVFGRRPIMPLTEGCAKKLRLRVEASDRLVRAYYPDNIADGAELWPEFEFSAEQLGLNAEGKIGFVYTTDIEIPSLCVSDFRFPEPSGSAYVNPVFADAQAADPGVLYYNGTYYCYSTSAPIGYYVYTSTDLVNWENRGLCTGEAWGFDRPGFYWAPEVVERGGRFYMIMSVNEHLGFAVAESPLGPFVPDKNWLFDHTIDGHIFIDDDGRAYLYYVSWREGHEYGIYGCALEDDIVTVKSGSEVHLMSPRDKWEMMEGRVVEGPFILKHNGKYYLTYSGSGYTSPDYAIGYAVSDAPLGSFERYAANPILCRTAELYGPGHHSFTSSPDGSELIIVYHVHNSTREIHPRKICIDRARFVKSKNGDDKLEILGPTHTAQQYPM